MSKKVQILKKITAKTIAGDVKKHFISMVEGGQKEKVLFRVMGNCTTYGVGEGDYGPWVKFKGNFKAINIETGAEFRAGAMLLPPIASDILEGLVADDSVNSIDFAFDIGIERDDSTAIGYVYTVTPLIDSGESDPLLAIERDLPALPKAEKSK